MSRNRGTVLVVDDEQVMREILEALLRQAGYSVRLAEDGEQGIRIVDREPIDLAVVDVMLPDISGLKVLERLREIDPEISVVMLTAFASVETAVTAIKCGAFDYLTKPFKNDEVLNLVGNGVRQRRLARENRSLREQLVRRERFEELVGKAPRMQEVYALIGQVAGSRANVLITGESGTGKELVAKAIHRLSPRKKRPFVTVHSGSLPPELLESNLFGHLKGAFTGAVAPKKGLFEIADGGSIFFDEIGTVHVDTQAKLLRVIQEKEFMNLGGVETIKVDVRVIAATNTDLKRLADQGKFREDLYFRLDVINIHLPPLRDRREDIPALTQHFLRKYGSENGKTQLSFSADAMQTLLDCPWPGNVRQLENAVERAVVLTPGNDIDASLLPDAVRSRTSRASVSSVPPLEDGVTLREYISEVERQLLLETLDRVGGVQKRAAEVLGLKPTTLNEMLKRHGIRFGRRAPETFVSALRGVR